MNNFREEVAQTFIKALEEDPIKFVKGWNFSETGSPINAFTNKEYSGVNKLFLKISEYNNNYVDNRWLTFKQIQDKGYHLEKGAKGTKVEFWLPFDITEEKWISWEEYEEKQGNSENEIELRQRLYTVFNASKVQGIEPKKFNVTLNEIQEEKVISRISEALGVVIEEQFNSPRAFYSPAEDKILIPDKKQFKSQGEYIRTALHELGHSTGHKTRLNRKFTGKFGSKSYAEEELIAEITSTFMGEYISEPMTEDILEQHKAYIQSWSKNIKRDKNFLFKAIKEADVAADYIVSMAHLKEYKNDIIVEEDFNKNFFRKRDDKEFEF